MNASQQTETTRFWSFASSRAVQLFAAATILALLIAAVLGASGLPFDRPAVAPVEMVPNLVIQVVQILLALLVIGVAFLVTRGRAAVDFDARTPEKAIAKRETIGLLVYGTVVLVLGSLFGVGMHLHGAVFGPTQGVVSSEVYLWAAYNFLLFAVSPYLTDFSTLWFRHGFTRPPEGGPMKVVGIPEGPSQASASNASR